MTNEKPKLNLSSQSHNLDRSSLNSTYLWTREYSGGQVVGANAVYLDQKPRRCEPTMFERLLHTVAYKARRGSQNNIELMSQQWKEDDKSVRDGTCSFQVQYLGSLEVEECKGVQACENAIKYLKEAASKTSKKSNELTVSRWASIRITSDTITVTDDESQNVIVEDSIRSISFCAAHRRFERYFAYIARLNGLKHRWICHAFSAITDSGERLNHAVGCAFNICHEKTMRSVKNDLLEEDELERVTIEDNAPDENDERQTGAMKT